MRFVSYSLAQMTPRIYQSRPQSAHRYAQASSPVSTHRIAAIDFKCSNYGDFNKPDDWKTLAAYLDDFYWLRGAKEGRKEGSALMFVQE